MEYLLEIQISMYMLKVQILVIYVRHTDFCLHLEEGSKEGDNLADYLLQI